MTAQMSNGAINGYDHESFPGSSLQDLPKSQVFTENLPPDPKFPTPMDSFKVHREELGPRMVKGALYTYIRPEGTEDPELLAVSRAAMRDIGIKEGEEETKDFKELVAGNKIFWDEKTQEGIYPWAQCYGGTGSQEAFKKNKLMASRLAIVITTEDYNKWIYTDYVQRLVGRPTRRRGIDLSIVILQGLTSNNE